MAAPQASTPVVARCHCGAVTLTLGAPPTQITHCNCSLCRSYGVLWAYYAKADVQIDAGTPTQSYAWNGKNVDFHRCANCGCITHWWPRKDSRNRVGINARLLDPRLIEAATLVRKDVAGTGLFH